MKNNIIKYWIYSVKDGKWNKYSVKTENEIIPFIEKIFEEDTTYRIIKQYIDHQEGYITIFNRLDLEEFRSELVHKQLEKDKILEKEYIFIEKR